MDESAAFARIWSAFDDGEILPVCAWCQRLYLDDDWVLPSRAALAAIDVRYAFSHSICETCARLLAGRNRAHECRSARGRLKIEQRPCLPPALGSD